MPDGDHYLYLCDPEPVTVASRLQCLPGRVAVLMHKGEKRGGLYMPPSGRLNPDVGYVYDTGTTYLKEGSEVIVRGYHGMWMDDFEDGRQLRLYGVICPWYESIVCVRTPLGFEPTYDWCLLKLDDAKTDLILPDALQKDLQFGQIRAIGDRVEEIGPSDDVVLQKLKQDQMLKLVFAGEEGLVLVREKHLLAAIR